MRGALEGLRRSGRADRIDRTVWAIQGTPQLPARLLLIVSGATPREFEMRLEAAAEQAGLTWVSSIAARRTFPLATTRRPACAHWAITVMCRGAPGNPRRVFNPPQDQPLARSGHPYPLDWWSEGNGRAGRPRLLRY